MPRKPEGEKIKCTYFTWVLTRRNGYYQADGRSNPQSPGRHALGTDDGEAALKALDRLDLCKAVELGLASPSLLNQDMTRRLGMAEGKELYLEHVNRPQVRGGVRASSKKRYRAVFDKFVPFALAAGCQNWHQLNCKLLDAYAAFLKKEGYKNATQYLELVTILQARNWMVKEGLLPKECKFAYELKKPKGTTTYCWTTGEVSAILAFCLATPGLHWLGDVLAFLAGTGMRISELVNLRWTDIVGDMISIVDESNAGHSLGHDARTTKTGWSREFPIRNKLLPILARQRRLPDGFVFHGPFGGRLKADLVRRKLATEVLLPLAKTFPESKDSSRFLRGRLHSFRHYFCSVSANKKVPEQTLMRWLGHHDSKMTDRYYHLKNEESRRLMDELDRLDDIPDTSPE